MKRADRLRVDLARRVLLMGAAVVEHQPRPPTCRRRACRTTSTFAVAQRPHSSRMRSLTYGNGQFWHSCAATTVHADAFRPSPGLRSGHGVWLRIVAGGSHPLLQ